MTSKLATALCAALLALPAMAGADEGKVGAYCETAAARLAENGYGALRVIDPQKRLLSGTTPTGEPVLLVLHPRNGHLQSLHPARSGGR